MRFWNPKSPQSIRDIFGQPDSHIIGNNPNYRQEFITVFILMEIDPFVDIVSKTAPPFGFEVKRDCA